MPVDADSGAREVAELLLRLGREAAAATDELTASQWMALRFFARANRFSRTVSAFADYQATTRGTASQTIKGLVGAGYLVRSPCDRDGRSARFDLTARARAMLRRDPFEAVVRAAARLAPARQAELAGELRRLHGFIAASRDRPAGGTCALCGHLGAGAEGFRCRLLDEPLAEGELDELCARFAARQAAEL